MSAIFPALAAASAWAQAPESPARSTNPHRTEPATSSQGRGFETSDPILQALIQEALDHNPELARNRLLVEAERERVPQARALPDPSLSLGIQNDGFQRLQIGRMESSYYQVMLTQGLPWPGKRAVRGEIARLGADATQTAVERARLSLVADVKRAYLGLSLVRAQLTLLDQQGLLQQQALDLVKTRYEVGQGSQADLLRAQLEQNRLRQKRMGLNAEERSELAVLRRLLSRTEARTKEDGTIPTTPFAESRPEPAARSAQAWMKAAEQESPELRAAHIGSRQAERSLDLAKRDRLPDFAVSAGVMPRGSLDPMWQVGVSISLPLWSKQKQQRAVAEQEIRRRAQGTEVENVRNILAQRIQEREAQFEGALENLQLYREGLLMQSEASFQASLAQYEGGRGSFLSVLEALNGWIADRSGYLQTLAQARAIQIAQEEFNLTGTPGISASTLNIPGIGMSGSPLGGGSANTKTSRPAGGNGPGTADSSSGSSTMKSM